MTKTARLQRPAKLTVREAANVYFKTRASTAPHDRFTWAGKAPEMRIFTPISRTHVGRLMRNACTAAKITPPAVFHDLRRSCGSLLLNAGIAAEAIQELLGHADVRMTRRAYAHMADATLKKAVKTTVLHRYG